MSYSFSDIENVLATMQQIADDKRSAFANRLKNLQRKGFPKGVNTGRGRAATYGAEHLFQLAFALELINFGYLPERAVEVIEEGLKPLAQAVLRVINSQETIVCHFAPRGLIDLQEPDRFEGYEPFVFYSIDELTDAIAPLGEASGVGVRLAVFSLSGLISIALFLARTKEDNDKDDSNWKELEAWSEGVLNGDP